MGKKKTMAFYLRSLHRDVGFLILGLTVIYAISGTILIFRKADYFKYENQIEVKLRTNLSVKELGTELQIKNFKVLEETDSLYFFETGNYNKISGLTNYKQKKYPALIENFNKLHKTSNKNTFYWAIAIYGILLLFLAVSSLWMMNPGTKQFKRSLMLVLTGCIIAFLFLKL